MAGFLRFVAVALGFGSGPVGALHSLADCQNGGGS